MQFDTVHKTQAVNAFNELPEPLRLQMQLSSVRLTNGRFTGSGVLVIDAQGTRGIVTAKHNLAVRAGIDTPVVFNQAQADQLILAFLDGLRVGYGPLNPSEVTAKNAPLPTLTQNLALDRSDIEFRSGHGSWDYDLMFISFKPVVQPERPPGVPDQPLPLETYIDESEMHRIRYRKEDKSFYQETMNARTVFVTGFGNVLNAAGKATGESHPFQVRTAKVTERLDHVRRHEHPNADYDDALIVTAADNTSTAPGDSGGPMFTVANKKVYLLGVSLGANFAANATIPDAAAIGNNAATYLLRDGQLF